MNTKKLTVLGLALGLAGMGLRMGAAPDGIDGKKGTNETWKTAAPRPTNDSATAAQPVKLESVAAAQAKAARLPVYVLPEVIVVNLPGRQFMFVENHHIQELLKKWPGFRMTNVVIYQDGL
ncbi:MAG: hypothetical protein PHE83_18750 [Opitutaceae bacterium]|nr:hypothetical protein [Opitutaceae bacterium]